MGTVAILFFDIADRTAALLATWPKPLPDKLTSCGLPALSSLIETLACLIPVVFGLNVTLIVQDFPTATLFAFPLSPTRSFPVACRPLVWPT